MSYLLTRGQSIKVFSQILRKCRQRNLLVPNMKVGLNSLIYYQNLGFENVGCSLSRIQVKQKQDLYLRMLALPSGKKI